MCIRDRGEAAVVLAQQVGGVPEADAAVVTGAQFGQQRLKLRDQRQGRRVLGAPAFRRRAHLAHGSCGCFDLSGGCGREVAREAAALAGEVGRRDASGIHEVHGPNAQFLKLLFPGLGPPRRLADDPVQFGLGTVSYTHLPFLKIREQFTAIILCAKNFLIDSGPIYCNNDSISSKILYLLQLNNFLPTYIHRQ